MKTLRACRQCRESKRRCSRHDPCEACEACRNRGLQCSAATSAVKPISRNDPGPLSVESTRGAQSVKGLPQGIVTELVENYLTRVHGGPHFHPMTLRSQVSEGSVKDALLCAICAIGSKFSLDAKIRAEEDRLAAGAKHSLHADLENICIDNVQVCILLATLSSGNCQPSTEALYVGELRNPSSFS